MIHFLAGALFVINAVLLALVGAIGITLYRILLPGGGGLSRYWKGSSCDTQNTWPAFKRSPAWRLIRWYYSLAVRHHHPLPAFPQNYILAMHPHGLFAVSGIVAFGFCNQFETTHLVAHSLLFRVPFLRELCQWIGAVDASRATLRHVLQEEKQSLALYPGGIREMQMSTHQKVDLLVEDPKAEGFLALAHELDIPVVPAFCENEWRVWKYWPMPKSWRQWCIYYFRYPTGLFFLGPFAAPLTIHTGKAVWPSAHPSRESFRSQYYRELAALINQVPLPNHCISPSLASFLGK